MVLEGEVDDPSPAPVPVDPPTVEVLMPPPPMEAVPGSALPPAKTMLSIRGHPRRIVIEKEEAVL